MRREIPNISRRTGNFLHRRHLADEALNAPASILGRSTAVGKKAGSHHIHGRCRARPPAPGVPKTVEAD